MAAAVDTVQTEAKAAAKGIQGFIKTNRAKAEGFVQEFRGKLEKSVADVKKLATENLDKVKALFVSFEKGSFTKARVAAEKAVEDGVKLTEETIAKLGLAKIADVSALKEAFETLGKKLDALKKKVDGIGKAPVAEAPKATEAAAKE